jgi:hypothetical protein
MGKSGGEKDCLGDNLSKTQHLSVLQVQEENGRDGPYAQIRSLLCSVDVGKRGSATSLTMHTGNKHDLH